MREISLQLRFEDSTELNFFEEKKIYNNLLKVMRHVAPAFLSGIELDLLILDDAHMKRINAERRGFSKTTDVLSFPLFQTFPPIPYQMIGEIVISLETLKKQAIEIGHTDIDEFYRLLVHGVLHLFGYDHETNEVDAVVMRQKEDECLELIFSKKHGS
jgi:probable rRNA maturation factor